MSVGIPICPGHHLFPRGSVQLMDVVHVLASHFFGVVSSSTDIFLTVNKEGVLGLLGGRCNKLFSVSSSLQIISYIN
jgi:hypothetical protein